MATAVVTIIDSVCGIVAAVLWVIWAWLLVFGHGISAGPVGRGLLFVLLLERFIAVGVRSREEWPKIFPKKRAPLPGPPLESAVARGPTMNSTKFRC